MTTATLRYLSKLFIHMTQIQKRLKQKLCVHLADLLETRQGRCCNKNYDWDEGRGTKDFNGLGE